MRSLVILAVAGALAGCATRPVAPRSSDAGIFTAAAAARGQGFARHACAGCHAIGRDGRSRSAHAPAFSDLAQRRTDAELLRVMTDIPRYGHVEMPPVLITGDELKDIAAYIGRLRGRPA